MKVTAAAIAVGSMVAGGTGVVGSAWHAHEGELPRVASYCPLGGSCSHLVLEEEPSLWVQKWREFENATERTLAQVEQEMFKKAGFTTGSR